MLKRTPEPELMNEEDQARAYAEADFEEPHDAFVAQFRDAHPGLPDSAVALDLGCGPGDITFRVARARPGWTIDGIDGSPAMLRFGQDDLTRNGLGDRVSLHHVYLPQGQPPRDAYDVVFSNSLLHHLHDPADLWTAAKTWARPGAPVFVMDLMRPADEGEVDRLVTTWASNEPTVLQRDFRASLHAAYRVDEVEAQLEAAGLAHLRVRAITDRHWIVTGSMR